MWEKDGFRYYGDVFAKYHEFDLRLPILSHQNGMPGSGFPGEAVAQDGSGDLDNERTSCAAPRRMASLGMPKTTQLASSWAIVNASACFISRRPSAPSSPMPVIKMPTALAPAACATERNNTLTLGRWRDTREPSRTSRK